MWSSAKGVRDALGTQLICPKIEGIANDQFAVLNTNQTPNLLKMLWCRQIFGHNQSQKTCCALGQSKWCWCNIHLPIPDHNVAICTKSFYTLVLVDVTTIGVKEVPMAYHQIDNRILAAAIIKLLIV